MHSIDHKSKIKKLVTGAFASVGKLDENAMFAANFLVDAICERNLPEDKVRLALISHAEKSEFVPKLCHIMSFINTPDQNEIADFLARFNKQFSKHMSNEMDDDVYTVKKRIGIRRVEDCLSENWVWVEKEAREIFFDLKSGKLELENNPRKNSQILLSGENTASIPPPNLGLPEGIPRNLSDFMKTFSQQVNQNTQGKNNTEEVIMTKNKPEKEVTK